MQRLDRTGGRPAASDVHTEMGGIVSSKMGCDKNKCRPGFYRGACSSERTHLVPLPAFLIERMDIGEVLLMGISPSEQKESRSHLRQCINSREGGGG